MSLLRLYLPIGLVMLVLFIGAALLIHAQPYDERAPAAVLVPVNCQTPCFMGIRPGAITMVEAMKLLQNNAWVSQVTGIPNETHPGKISWNWNENAPAYLQKSSVYNDFDGNILSTTDLTVSNISFNTSIGLTQMPTVLKNIKADAVIFYGAGKLPQPDPTASAIIVLWFTPLHLSMNVVKGCPYYTGFEQIISKVLITDYTIQTTSQMMQTVPAARLIPTLYQTSLQVCGY